MGLFLNGTAAPLNGDSFDLVQPDGSTVSVVAWGDEFYQRIETPDGYTLIRNSETGWICFAELAADSSELVPTDRIYQPHIGLLKIAGTATTTQPPPPPQPQHLKLSRKAHLQKHQQVRKHLLGEEEGSLEQPLLPAPPASIDGSSEIMPLMGTKPVTGNFVGLTIVVDFSDQVATVPIDSINDFVNKRNYTGFRNSGSVRDFFFDISSGKVDYQNIVVGYYRAKKPKTYYDSRGKPFGNLAQELVTEALNWLKDDGFDFSRLSTTTTSATSTRKNLQAINFLYAGSPSQGWSEGLWPHQGRLNNISLNNVYATKYQMSNIGSSLTLGTFCHENGHMVFNYPDLYDYGSESQGVGVYCLMCNTGGKSPIPPCAYLRDLSGWDVVTDITDMAAGTVLSQLPAETNNTFVFRNKSNAKEMFYIEARRRAGRFQTLPDSGFLIWHVDRNGSNDNEKMTSSSHYMVSLIQADNAFQLEKNINSGRAGDLFRKGYKDKFDDNTGPSAKWWDGSNSGMKIFNMSSVSDTMTFSCGDSTGTRHTILASAGAHGSLIPSGRISVTAGSSLKFALLADSGYQIDAITVDDAPAAIVDTIRMNAIKANHSIKVAFGLKGALSVVAPRENDIFYAGDTVPITWRTGGVSVQGINLAYSINSGSSFTSVVSGLPATDTTFFWVVPAFESSNCLISVANTNANPTAKSGLFSIRKKPKIALGAEQLVFTVDYGKSKQQTLLVNNRGTGDLRITTTTRSQINNVMINELSIGSDSNAPDAIELLNAGVDMDLSGWQVVWDDNKSTSGNYTFPKGFVFKGGSTFVVNDLPNDTNSSSGYMGVNAQWLFSDSLALAVTLFDAAGSGVDFVKSPGIPITPPEGTSWSGNGIPLCNAFVGRVGLTDRNSAIDWDCSATGTLKQYNGAQTALTVPPLLAAHPLTVTVPGAANQSLTMTLDATTRNIGTYIDTIVIYHNDPEKPSPIRIPCTITVTNPSKVLTRPAKSERQAASGRLIAAPNPVPPGESAFFEYHPTGNERSGILVIYSSVGNCLASEEVDFSKVDAFRKDPVRFSWLPRSKSGHALRHGTLLARLVVKRADGTQEGFSIKIGLQ